MNALKKWICLLLAFAMLLTGATAYTLRTDHPNEDEDEGDIIWEPTESTDPSESTEPAEETEPTHPTINVELPPDIFEDEDETTAAEEPTEPTEPTTDPDEGDIIWGWENPFTDVSETGWSFPGIAYVSRHGLMNGTSDSTFSPSGTMTRAMLVTVLWRCAGEPEAVKAPFTDVPAGKWYTTAVAWAAEQKVVNGVSATRFAPNDPITREQMAAILCRYAAHTGLDTSDQADLSGFADRSSVSSWALPSLRWAVSKGLINGIGSNLKPQGNATREQVATILMRYFVNN